VAQLHLRHFGRIVHDGVLLPGFPGLGTQEFSRRTKTNINNTPTHACNRGQTNNNQIPWKNEVAYKEIAVDEVH